MIGITDIALRRLRHNKSRTILTMIAFVLTAALLSAIGAAAVGVVDFQQKTIASGAGNHHAALRGVTYAQGALLEMNAEVEALVFKEQFAEIVQDRLNAALNVTDVRKEGIIQPALTAGRMPEAENEIAGPPSLFERLGAEPEIGSAVTISFRVQGAGEIQTREFIICGLQEQADLSKLNVTDARLAFGAEISENLVSSYLDRADRQFSARLRVDENRTFGEIEEHITQLAEDIGLGKTAVSLNSTYLMWMTDPGSETAVLMIGAGLIVALFGGLVIYNIYYVSVISNIQELGKLKALGATKKQIRRLFLTEGMALAGVSLPTGLVLGHLCAGIVFRFMRAGLDADVGSIRIFSLPVVLAVIAAVLITTCFSLRKPMKMAAKISPVEAMRYQEAQGKDGKSRKGYAEVNILRLSAANLARGRRRTLAAVLTMGMSCVLFLTIATVLGNLSAEDYARQALPKGEFMLSLNYSLNDAAYPENNLDQIQPQSPLGDALLHQVFAIEGVTAAETRYAGAAAAVYDGLPAGEKISVGTFSREETEWVQERVKLGDVDYDRMIAENGIVFTWHAFWEEYGFEIGDTIPLVFQYGGEQIVVDAVLHASAFISENDFWIPEEVLLGLLPEADWTETLYIHAQAEQYDSVKEALQEIELESGHFSLFSMDEELRIAEKNVATLRYPVYGLLIVVGVISFMSLINTMITSILTRKRELGILQAIGMSNKQLEKMLQGEGLLVIAGALICGLLAGSLFGFAIVRLAAASGLITVLAYHYPAVEAAVLVIAAVAGQIAVTACITRYLRKETIVSRIASQTV